MSALDVSIRAQIMNLLKDLQAEYQVSYLLIAHHLATVRLNVRLGGGDVPGADCRGLLRCSNFSIAPSHPYTKALMSAALPSHPDLEQDEMILTGEVPSPLNPPEGCRSTPAAPSLWTNARWIFPVTKEIAPANWCPATFTNTC